MWIKRNNISDENREKAKEIVKVLLTKIFFPIIEELDFYLGKSKETGNWGVAISWSGKFNNPLDEDNEDAQFIKNTCSKLCSIKMNIIGHN